MPSVFVTGSSKGIGLSIARRLASRGWNVAINGRNPELVSRVAEEIGSNAFAYPCDVNDHEKLLESLKNFSKTAGALDSVVHSAGVMQDAPLGMLTDEKISNVFATNSVSALDLVQTASRLMARQKKGTIVLINSVVGLDGAKGQTLYSMSKSALSGLVKSAAKELGTRGIRINGIAPGLIQTDLIAGFSTEEIAKLTERIPLGRLGNTDDVSPLVEFLLSEESGYITGQTFRVDGGYSV